MSHQSHAQISEEEESQTEKCQKLLEEAIEAQNKFNEATQLPEVMEKFKKIPTGSTSDVVVLGPTHFRGQVMGARWWPANDKGKSYLSIMQFQPVKAQDSNEIEYQPVNFDRRISLTLDQFNKFQKSFPLLVEYYYECKERDDQRLQDLKEQETQIEAANQHMQTILNQQGGSKRKYPRRK